MNNLTIKFFEGLCYPLSNIHHSWQVCYALKLCATVGLEENGLLNLRWKLGRYSSYGPLIANLLTNLKTGLAFYHYMGLNFWSLTDVVATMIFEDVKCTCNLVSNLCMLFLCWLSSTLF